MSVMGFVFFFFPEPLARAFISKDQAASSAAVVPLIVSYLKINALSEPLFAVGMTLRGALQGAGDVRVPTLLTAIALWGFRIPMTWLLALHLNMGVTGAWIAMSFTTGLSGILSAIWFKHGAWKNQQI
jgi:Na+-driven multidrug efflux pump